MTLNLSHWRAVLFDLDGTLVDTFGDIALALERSCADQNWPCPPRSLIRDWIGKGAPNLVGRLLDWAEVQGLRSRPAPADEVVLREDLLTGFFTHTEGLHARHESQAALYPGVLDCVKTLHAQGLALAVVTNKRHASALDVLLHVGLRPYFSLVVGGDTCAQRKPHPEPLLHACGVLGAPTPHALMVGDSVNDVQAARAGRLPVVAVSYGYNEGQDPRHLDCDALMDNLQALPAWMAAAQVPGGLHRQP